jgi:uncharacterized membrane protein
MSDVKEERKIRRKLGALLSIIASMLGIGGASLQALSMLESLGVTTIFEAVELSSAAKVEIAFYLTPPVTMFTLALFSGLFIFRDQPKLGAVLAVLGVIAGLYTLVLPQFLGYAVSQSGFIGILGSIILTGAITIIGFTTPRMRAVKTSFVTTVEIAVASVFSALTAILTGTAFMPSPTGGYTHIGDTMIFLAALLFGCKVGGIVGMIGPVAADLFVGYSRWFVTIPAHGIEGLIAGVGKGRNMVTQVLLCMLGGFVMATTYFFVNIFIKGYPLAIVSYIRDLFGQALISMILGISLTKIVKRALPQLKRFE